ncbi:MAG TPA: hypothetical protein VD767_02765 [Thermomicrobiales bacterium]|nr:hypothetical protein [Thermomicrobiales bacterium]
MGLLFVTLTLRPDIRAQGQGSFRRRAVDHSFVSYITVLLYSLFFLIPHEGWTSLGVMLLLTSVYPLAALVHSWARHRRSSEIDMSDRLWIFAVPMFGYLGALAVALGFLFHSDREIWWFVPIVGVLLTIPTRNAWDLMLGGHETSADASHLP